MVIKIIEARRTNDRKKRIDVKEDDAECLMRLEENCLSWAAVARQNDWLWSLSITAIEAIDSEKVTRIEKAVFHQHNAKLYRVKAANMEYQFLN